MSKFCIVANFYTCLCRSSVLYPKCRHVYGLSWYHMSHTILPQYAIGYRHHTESLT